MANRMRHVEVYVFSGRRSGRRWRHDRTAYRAHLLQHIRRYLIRVVADGMVEIGGRLGAQRLILRAQFAVAQPVVIPIVVRLRELKRDIVVFIIIRNWRSCHW